MEITPGSITNGSNKIKSQNIFFFLLIMIDHTIATMGNTPVGLIIIEDIIALIDH